MTQCVVSTTDAHKSVRRMLASSEPDWRLVPACFAQPSASRSFLECAPRRRRTCAAGTRPIRRGPRSSPPYNRGDRSAWPGCLPAHAIESMRSRSRDTPSSANRVSQMRRMSRNWNGSLMTRSALGFARRAAAILVAALVVVSGRGMTAGCLQPRCQRTAARSPTRTGRASAKRRLAGGIIIFGCSTPPPRQTRTASISSTLNHASAWALSRWHASAPWS